MQLWLLEWGFMCTEAGCTATCLLASPELGAQEGPSLPPSTIHYGTDFNISLSEV